MHPKTLSINTHHLVLMANVKDAPFRCSTCKKVFISDNHLKRHEDRRHNSKVTPIPSVQMKESTIYQTADDPTIKAVLNATERIEDLLGKLAIRENEKKPNIPTISGSSKSNCNDSLTTSSSSTTESNEQDIENYKHISNSSTPNKIPKDRVNVEYNTTRNFKDNLAVEKNKQNDGISSNRQKEITILECNENSSTKYIPVSSNSSTTKNYGQYIENGRDILNSNASKKIPTDIFKTEYSPRKFEYNLVTSNSVTNEQIIENHEYLSNNSTSIKKYKDMAKLKCKTSLNFDNSPFASNFSFLEKSEQNIENSEYISNDSASAKNRIEVADLKQNGTSNFEDTLGTSNFSINDKNEQNIGNREKFSQDSVSSKKRKKYAELELNDRSDFEDTQVCSSSYIVENSEQNIESSDRISLHSFPLKKSKEITKMTCSDFLEDEENKAIWRITSSIIKSSNFSLEVLDPVYSENDRGGEENELINPHSGSFLQESPKIKSHSSVKSEILKKLNRKLESYGVNSSQNTLSDRDMMRIERFLKEERDIIAEEVPDYHNLRQLIKDNAHRRIEENLRVHNTYVS